MTIGFPTYGLLCPFCFSIGHPWPICFLWASLSLLLTLHSHGLLLTSLGFLGPITSFSSLGFMGLSLTPYFLCLHYVGPAMVHSHFSISYTTHGYAISLFSGFLKPDYLLKAHLFIAWDCDPLFLPLEPNGFATCLPTLCCPCCWAFFFPLGFSKMTLNTHFEGYVKYLCRYIITQLYQYYVCEKIINEKEQAKVFNCSSTRTQQHVFKRYFIYLCKNHVVGKKNGLKRCVGKPHIGCLKQEQNPLK